MKKEAKMIRDIKTGYMQPNEMLMKQFELLNSNMNKHMEDEKKTIDNKNNIIEMMMNKIKIHHSKKMKLSSLFGNMKIKTENSDIIAATTGTDIIDVNKRIDTLEQYLYQIMETQYKIIQKLEESPVQFKVVEQFHNNSISRQNEDEKTQETQETQETEILQNKKN